MASAMADRGETLVTGVDGLEKTRKMLEFAPSRDVWPHRFHRE